jgi:hypothetical protein
MPMTMKRLSLADMELNGAGAPLTGSYRARAIAP